MGEDAKVKGTQKGGSGGKKESFLSLYFHIRAFADQTISETGTEARAV